LEVNFSAKNFRLLTNENIGTEAFVTTNIKVQNDRDGINKELGMNAQQG
jgi:hypothetical protein